MVNQSLHPSSTALGTKGSDILFLQSAERLQGVPDLKTHAWSHCIQILAWSSPWWALQAGQHLALLQAAV